MIPNRGGGGRIATRNKQLGHEVPMLFLPMKSNHHFIWIALVLLIVWIVLRVALAITSVALHVLWIAAIISLILWVWRQFSRPASP